MAAYCRTAVIGGRPGQEACTLVESMRRCRTKGGVILST
jgi:hypothetical protein